MPEFLPLGSVVRLDGGEKLVMIVGRLQRHDATGQIFDYAAVLWPEGCESSDRFYLFNHKDIAQLYSIGMQNEEEFQFRFVLEEQYEQLK
jgi:hypothetical protein